MESEHFVMITTENSVENSSHIQLAKIELIRMISM